MDDNYVSVVGRLVADPEIRFLADGTPVCNFRVARNRRKLVDGVWQDDRVQYFDVAAWRNLGEKAASLAVGTMVRVTGELDYETWENEAGEKRSRHRIVARGVDAVLVTARSVEGYKGSLQLVWGKADEGQPRTDDEPPLESF